MLAALPNPIHRNSASKASQGTTATVLVTGFGDTYFQNTQLFTQIWWVFTFTFCISFRTLVRYKLPCYVALNSPNLVKCWETQGNYSMQGWLLSSFVCLRGWGGGLQWSLNFLPSSVSSSWWIVGERIQPHYKDHFPRKVSWLALPPQCPWEELEKLLLLWVLSWTTLGSFHHMLKSQVKKFTSIWPDAK